MEGTGEEDIFDLSRSPTSNEINCIVRIIKKLYCHGIAQEFRKPVQIMYPEIADHYMNTISEPMDLGTLLYLIIENKLSIAEILNKLKLIFSNAILFNQDAHQMIAISTHINRFAKALWHEAIRLPYIGDVSKKSFKHDRIADRFHRYRFVFNLKMTMFEAKELTKAMSTLKNQVMTSQQQSCK